MNKESYEYEKEIKDSTTVTLKSGESTRGTN